jgi:hypothetical protein
MNTVKLGRRRATVELDEDEVMLLNNALNEVCNGVHISDAEFATRLGGDRAETRRLLDRIHELSREMEESSS